MAKSPTQNKEIIPAILAPAGNQDAFLAALAAGADAIYCGLKRFSARMAAKNFTIESLQPLADLARQQSTKIFIALNTLIKTDEMSETLTLVEKLEKTIQPDALIIQDLGMIKLARQAGFSGQLHLSTLANASFTGGLMPIKKKLGVHRVVIPRELTIDEIKPMAAACPTGLDLEIFIHGALCYAVSGRCYWSSYLGGKSGLRGRCVQPCRRIFAQKGKKHRFFSCQDFSLDVLVKVIRPIKQIKAWKIEGRKKGPHYVYYTTTAYKMLRDEGKDSKIRKSAVQLLARSLGRTGSHYHFLPQRPFNPIDLDSRTGSGLLMGHIRGPARHPFVKLREALLNNDIIRVGYEDEPWHQQVRVNRSVPAGGQFQFNKRQAKTPPKGTPVFLTDRREPALMEMIAGLENRLEKSPGKRFAVERIKTSQNRRVRIKKLSLSLRTATCRQLTIGPALPVNNQPSEFGVWLFSNALDSLAKDNIKKAWFSLPPVIWPLTEEKMAHHIQSILDQGGRRFVLNAPWQIVLFSRIKSLELWAGPFCNTANPLAVETLADLGFKGAVVSPELDKVTTLNLPRQSVLPLGIVVSGNWPLCLSRIVSDELIIDQPFVSPRKEAAWVTRHDDMFWTYPNWPIELTDHLRVIEEAGYHLLINLVDPPPKNVKMKKRPGKWNWSVGLK